MAFAAPPSALPEQVRGLVGDTSFRRGGTYARKGSVYDLTWNAGFTELSGKVEGSRGSAYRTTVKFSGSSGAIPGLSYGLCSCPMRSNCKHVAALLLTHNAAQPRASRKPTKATPAPAPGPSPAPQQQKPSPWQRRLDALVNVPKPASTTHYSASGYGSRAAAPTVPLALHFEVHGERDYSTSAVAVFLSVKAVQRSTAGNWVTGQLRWEKFQGGYSAGGLEEAHWDWMCTFAAVGGRGQSYGYSHGTSMKLNNFRSPLLWDLLAQGREAGVEFVGTGDARVTLHDVADVHLDVSAAGRGLHLAPHLEVGGRVLDPAAFGLIGTPAHGLFWWDAIPTQAAGNISLARTRAPVPEALRSLVTANAPLKIPGTGRQAFLEEYYPQLQQQVRVISRDGSVDLPEIAPPTLVLTLTYIPAPSLSGARSRRRSAGSGEASHGAVRLGWSWDYTHAGTTTTHLLPDDGSRHRDRAAEKATLAAVAGVLDGFRAAWFDAFPRPADGVPGRSESLQLEGVAAARFVAELVPELETVERVRVVQGEDLPDYTELTEQPEVSVSTTETEDRDWFGLGVSVSLGGIEVPFGELFRALALDERHLLLPGGGYFALDQPEFEQLRRLIEEARSLQEKDTGELRISRFQASLWEEFTDLATVAAQADAWRESVSALLELSEVPVVPVPAGINATLRPYQQEGFSWLVFLWKHGLGGVLADDMGLGKTLQTLALISHTRESAEETRPFLVVAPTSVVPNWAAEAHRFAPHLRTTAVMDTLRRSGAQPAELAADNDVVIVSYTLFRLDYELYATQDWAGLILDEAQFVKNPLTRGSQNARSFPAPFKLAITGTPMENNLMELWSLFAITAPGLFPSSKKFAEYYQRPIEKDADRERLAQLRRRIRPLITRRTKELVAKDLPPKQEQVLELELSPRHRTIYQRHLQRERQKVLGLLDDMNRNRFEIFRSLTMLRRLSLDASLVDEKYASVPSSKLDALFEQLEDIVAEGHRALIFSQFTGFLAKAAERLDAAGMEYAYLDGKTRRRAQVVEKFKSGKAPVFLISLKAGGFGLNLAEADYCFLLDPWWNPASENQAVDRAHRIGQTRNVMVYRLVAKDTIEEKVMALKEKKAKLFTAVMDDDAMFSSALTAGDVRNLFE
ncbi:DEAD/DEAH box helicase [Arthrobacter sp. CAN_C5]|uniref:DEAD/DEAH box helicase n=1 Tax=Arthrobacter sp. CAN_C5 TaxID=2760706 RepID=UPI001AE86450|nr:DEAD/DEAH box helicase [Arthrobacter sp. CAN_C5]MBP2218001.1 superfamily II DNA or RNA helicase [Arthrobacter sp. CAN_C5]